MHESTIMPPKHLAGKKQIVVLLDPDLHQAFKIATAEAGGTMQDVLHKAIEEYAEEALKRLRRARKKAGNEE
jgi:hypothetical protein